MNEVSRKLAQAEKKATVPGTVLRLKRSHTKFLIVDSSC